MPLYVIWSEEHGAWWAHAPKDAPRRGGYTDWLRAAGRYTKEEADAIVFQANAYLEIGAFNEVEIPDPLPHLAAERAYRDPRQPDRKCEHCGEPYRGPALYCSLACAQADA